MWIHENGLDAPNDGSFGEDISGDYRYQLKNKKSLTVMHKRLYINK